MKITLAVRMDEHFFEQLAAAIQMASYLQFVNGWWTASEPGLETNGSQLVTD